MERDPFYEDVNRRIIGLNDQEFAAFVEHHLVDHWCDEYYSEVSVANPQVMDIGSFTVIFDFTASLDDSDFQGGSRQADRVIAIYGRSCPPQAVRDAVRMRGFLGETFDVFGHGYDKGHFIAHTAGGDILDSVNWFRQERRLNRGWSEQGKIYRKMERFCAVHPGTFLFARPIYGNSTADPDRLEFGILRDGALDAWIFDNRSQSPNAPAPRKIRSASAV